MKQGFNSLPCMDRKSFLKLSLPSFSFERLKRWEEGECFHLGGWGVVRTEVGPISLHFPDHSLQENWSYFILSPQLTTRLIPHGDQIYELIILVSPPAPLSFHKNQWSSSNVPRFESSKKSSDRHRCSLKKLIKGLEHQEYSTHDLIQKHPRLNLYRVVGRLDDQIMLSNGEKTNPYVIPLPPHAFFLKLILSYSFIKYTKKGGR